MADPYLAGLGTVSVASSSVTADITTAPAAGDGVFAFLLANASGATLSSLTDTQGGTWTAVATETATFVLLCYQRTAGPALTTADSVTFTMTGGTQEPVIAVAGVPAWASTDASGTASGLSGTSLSVSTAGTTTAAGEVALAMFCDNFGGGTATWTGGWTSLVPAGTESDPSGPWFNLGWVTTGAAGSTVTATATLGASASKAGGVIVTFIQSSSVPVSSFDSAAAAEGSSVHAAMAKGDTAHAAEGARVRVAGTDSGRGLEGPAVHASLAKADTVHAVEAGSVNNGTAPHSADRGLATESAFYYHPGADVRPAAAEGFTVGMRGADSASGTDRPLKSWPGSSDASRAADAPLWAWPRGTDAGHGTEGVRPFPAASADAGHGSDSAHEIGIWTYVPSGVRLLLKGKYRPGKPREVLAAEQARLTAAVLRLAAGQQWARATVRVASRDRAGAAEREQIPERWGD